MAGAGAAAPDRAVPRPDPLALAARTGLPDALRVLLERHPRPGWEGDPHFDGLTRFWLDRHLAFRRLQDALGAETRAALDRAADPRASAGRIGRLARALIGELDGHHRIEDLHYFPRLAAAEPRLEAGFALLDRDHEALHGALESLAGRTDAALRGLAARPAEPAPLGALEAELGRFARLLDRHLIDEEELVVPVILAHPGVAG